MKRILAAVLALATLLTSAPALANGRADYIPGLDQALRRHIQQRLKAEGYYRGPIDGQIGRGSRAAIERYRIEKGISECEDVVEEEEVAEEGDCEYSLNLYLTPKLIQSLLGISMGSGTEELSREQLRELLRQLRARPATNAVGPDE
jgi:peptidoglycan hydrolase-like protein with peptidoglycan-binding domain